MGSSSQNVLQAAIVRLLTPLVRLLLRHGVSLGAFVELAKRVYVDLALREFGIPGRKSTISRASIITGLTRKEVTRVSHLPTLSDATLQDRYNRAVRVIGGWSRDAEFHNAQGEPAPLPLEGGSASFSALVRRYSGDVPARALLDELLRVGAVRQDAQGAILLESKAYIPTRTDDEKLAILGTDVADLVGTIDYNLSHPPDRSRLQLKVSYDNLPVEPLAAFRGLAATQAFELLQRLDRELSALDRDANPKSQGSGRMRAGVGIFYFEEPCEPEE